jgi:hypothetical protein
LNRTILVLALTGWLAGCSSLLPRSKETSGGTATAWQSYEEAEQAFARITPGTTSVRELAALRLDPRTNPNITVVPRFAVKQRFMVNSTVTLADLDEGVRECIAADSACVGWEINQSAMQKKRNGNAALDTLRMRRETHSSGWRFTGLLLIKDGVVLYKLAGGRPLIHEIAQTEDMLGPLQALGGKLNAINGIDVTDVRNGIKALAGGNAGHVEAVGAIRIRR